MRFSLLFICCIIMSCKLRVNSDTKDLEYVKTEVRGMLDNYAADVRAKGLMAEFKYLDSSDNFFWVPPGYSAAISYDSVKAAISRNAVAFKLVNNRWDTLRIIPLSEEIANYTGVVKSEIVLQNDSVMYFNMVETGTIIKRKDGWKLLSGQTTMLTN